MPPLSAASSGSKGELDMKVPSRIVGRRSVRDLRPPHTAKLSAHVHRTGKPDMKRQPMRRQTAIGLLLAVLATGLHAQQPTRWRGDFLYFADAAVFTDCATGQRWPVAMAGDFVALQQAYMRWQSAPMTAMLANFEGRLEVREAMEGPPREH